MRQKQKTRKIRESVYILAKKCECPYNLTRFLTKSIKSFTNLRLCILQKAFYSKVIFEPLGLVFATLYHNHFLVIMNHFL